MNDPVTSQKIFEQVVECPHDQRDAMLDRLCGNNIELKRDVLRLLHANSNAGSFLERPVIGEHIDAGALTAVGDRIGAFELKEQIGEGGFGQVFIGHQDAPVKRDVAIKLIKPGMATKEVLARFEAERHALALMNHPNIARILDAGVTQSGQPYFVMELVDGVPITEYCDQHQLNARERISLFTVV